MKIQYEPGDVVFRADDYGGHTLTITAIRQNGVVVSDQYGVTFFLGKRQIEPHPGTVVSAEWISASSRPAGPSTGMSAGMLEAFNASGLTPTHQHRNGFRNGYEAGQRAGMAEEIAGRACHASAEASMPGHGQGGQT